MREIKNTAVRGVALACAALSLMASANAGVAGAALRPAAPTASLQHHHHPGLLPAMAQPYGFSLKDVAHVTAAFNIGDHTGVPPQQVDGSGFPPIQMIYSTPTNSFMVKRNTVLYVPLLAITDPGLDGFPDVKNRGQVLNFIYGASQIGLQHATVTVDGKPFSLDENYVAATSFTQALPDGGHGYIAVGAYVKALPPGHHTVDFSVLMTGSVVGGSPVTFSQSYQITVY
jgi:hypothetical protein